MYTASKDRYTTMEYSHCGNSGLMLPKVSLGLWHNFGDTANFENMKQLCFTAFDNGITQFDLANNYGPEPGSAEKNFGKILKEDLGIYRDELIITTKAGYEMWDGLTETGGAASIFLRAWIEPETYGTGICGYFLSSQNGSGYPAGGNNGSTGKCCSER